jgi:hypothetical protein
MSNSILAKTNKWLTANRLTLNQKKTVYMVFDANKRKCKSALPKVFIQNYEVLPVPSTKYLGFIIDSKLSCKLHNESLVLKISRIIGLFRVVSKSITFQAKYNLYYSMLFPHLLYCIEIYGSVGRSEINDLQIKQNKAIRALFRLPRLASASVFYEKLGIEKIDGIYKKRATKLVTRLLHEYNKSKRLNVFQTFSTNHKLFNHKYKTRHKDSINLTFNRHSFTTGIIFNLLLNWNNRPH